MKVYVTVSVYEGTVDSVEVYSDSEDAHFRKTQLGKKFVGNLRWDFLVFDCEVDDLNIPKG